MPKEEPFKAQHSIAEMARHVMAMSDRSGITCMDAIVEYSEFNDIELETLASMVRRSPSLMARLTEECEDRRLLKRSPRLPFED